MTMARGMRSNAFTRQRPRTLRNAFVFLRIVSKSRPTLVAASRRLSLSRRTKDKASRDFSRIRLCCGDSCFQDRFQMAATCLLGRFDCFLDGRRRRTFFRCFRVNAQALLRLGSMSGVQGPPRRLRFSALRVLWHRFRGQRITFP